MILLGRDDVNTDRPDQPNTPLDCALENGHKGVVKIVLGQDNLNPAKQRKLG